MKNDRDSTVSASSSPGTMEFKLNRRSIVFYATMAFVHLLLLILSLVSLGTFVTKSNEIKRDLASIYRSSDEPCWLYAGGRYEFRPRSGPERNCEFVIAGQVMVFLAAVALVAVSVVKAVLSAPVWVTACADVLHSVSSSLLFLLRLQEVVVNLHVHVNTIPPPVN